jgi:hypothetical protein
MTVFDNTMIDAVVRIARSDAQRWALFRREQAGVTHHETDFAAEQALRYWVDPSRRIRAINGWVQQFALDFSTEAANGRCRVSGFVGTTEIEVPAALFTSSRLIKDLWEDGKGIYENEIRLPDGTLVAAVRVSWGKEKPPEPSAARSPKRERPHWAEASPSSPAATNAPPQPRKRGPKGELGQRVEAQMRAELQSGELTIEQFSDMPEKAWPSRYGVKSRTTARNARNRVLADIEFIDECRQTPTNDKKRLGRECD